MGKVMSATEARVRFGEVLRRVENNETVTVERSGQAAAVVISIQEYERLKKRDGTVPDWRERLLDVQQKFREQVGDQVIDVEEIIRTMREERSDQLFENLH